jgi:hypothetical protein
MSELNLTRLVQLAYMIENSIAPKAHPTLKFDMMTYWGIGMECGTAACIAGWAVATFRKDQPQTSMQIDVKKDARDILGLDPFEAHQLFVPPYLSRRTAADAVQVLRNLAITGKVEWEELSDE